MDVELDKLIKNLNLKYNLKKVVENLEFIQQNDIYYTKEIEGKNIHVKFDDDEFIIWSSESDNKYVKYYNSLRSEKERGLYDENDYINDTLYLLIKGGN